MKQNKTMRRIFSLLLCLSMVLVYIPVSAFAANIPGGIKLYLEPNSNWNRDNARFAAYFFGNGEAWASMTKVEGESNLYEVTVPNGNWPNVIFCRMNPGTSANNWDNKWNQTSDLTFDGTKNCYTVKEDTWDKGGGTWSVYTPPECLHPEFADGACTACGEKLHNVTVADVENGIVRVDVAQGLAGTIVTATAIADENYKLESLTAMCGEAPVEITAGQFVMPAGDVTVSATFVEIVDEEYITVYFQNSDGWTDVNVYYWYGNINNTWPGEPMTLKGKDHTFSTDDKYDVYSFHIPVDATNFLINGKKEGNSVKTLDLTVGTEDGICYYVQKDGTAGIFDPNAVEYNITVEPSENGTVTASDTAREGALVVLNAAPDAGYLLESWTVMFGDEELEVTDNKFTMPAGDVTVSATFTEIVDEEYITIYFQNNLEWTDVKAYYWNDTINNSWPGEFMTLKGKDHTFSANGQYDVYSFHIPVDATNFLINGKKDGNDKQTTDLLVGTEDGICYCLQGENAEGKYITGIVAEPGAQTYEITVVTENGTVSVYESAAEGESVLVTATPNEGYLLESLTVMNGEEAVEVIDGQFTMPAGNVTVTAIFREIKDEDVVTIYFQNNWFWTDVNIYYWGSENFENPAWPDGVAMTKVENPVDGYSNGGTYEVYSFDVPADVDGFLIKGTKNDGSGAEDKTPDIKEGFFDGICYYMWWDNKNNENKVGAMISPDVLGVDTPVNKWNISLGDDIGVNFVVDSAMADLLEFCIGETVLAKQVSANGDGTSTVSVALAAAQMADIITIKGCGVAFEKTYSVLDYAKEILADPELAEDAPLRYLVTEMLNYGAAAQMHFQYNTENLVKKDYTKDHSLTLEAAAAVEVADSMNGLGYYGASMLFRNKIAVRFYFTGSVEDCTFTVGENTYEPVLKDGRYYVEVADIAPDALDQQITLKVTDANGAEISVTYGPMNYIKRMYEKEDTSESLKDVLENLYHYHKAAVAYVESLAAEA